MTFHAPRNHPPADALAGADVLDGWLAAVPDLVSHVEATAHPRIADVGCETGTGTLALADAFPHAWIDGFDADPACVAAARRRAARAGLDGRVRFLAGDLDGVTAEGLYDLVLLRGARTGAVAGTAAIRSALRPGAGVLLAASDGAPGSLVRSEPAREEWVTVAHGLQRLRD